MVVCLRSLLRHCRLLCSSLRHHRWLCAISLRTVPITYRLTPRRLGNDEQKRRRNRRQRGLQRMKEDAKGGQIKRGRKRINEDARGSYNSKREHPRASSSSPLSSSPLLSSPILELPLLCCPLLSSAFLCYLLSSSPLKRKLQLIQITVLFWGINKNMPLHHARQYNGISVSYKK